MVALVLSVALALMPHSGAGRGHLPTAGARDPGGQLRRHPDRRQHAAGADGVGNELPGVQVLRRPDLALRVPRLRAARRRGAFRAREVVAVFSLGSPAGWRTKDGLSWATRSQRLPALQDHRHARGLTYSPPRAIGDRCDRASPARGRAFFPALSNLAPRAGAARSRPARSSGRVRAAGDLRRVRTWQWKLSDQGDDRARLHLGCARDRWRQRSQSRPRRWAVRSEQVLGARS